MQAIKAKQMNKQLIDGVKLLQETYYKKNAWIQTEAQVILMLKIWANTNRRLVKEIK